MNLVDIQQFATTFVTEGLNQPYLPPEIGFFGYPIWGVWIMAAFGLLTQQGSAQRTTRQRRVKTVIQLIFWFLILWGAVKAIHYTLEVL